MKKTVFFLAWLCLAGASSCTKDRTDYGTETGPEIAGEGEFREAFGFQSQGYAFSVEVPGGAFRKGYNAIRLKAKGEAELSAVTFLPVRTSAEGETSSCPHQYELTYSPADGHFSGYAVFTEESGADGNWDVYIGFTVAGKKHTVQQRIPMSEQPNKNLGMAAFEGTDGERYCIALIAPRKPKVGENELVAGIYRYNRPTEPPIGDFPDPVQFAWTEATGMALRLDPRMPEPSMGNHSSPNNKDLAPRDDGLYHGTVNYTMTGNWTLNLILQDGGGKILKGTEVPKAHTPGVDGAKSELHIDVII